MYKRYISVLSVIAALSVNAAAQTDTIQSSLSPTQTITYGGDIDLTLEESTGAVSVIGNSQINRRSAKNISADILGQGNGMQSLQNAGLYSVTNPTFYVRGLQTLNDNNTPLFIVDGIERDINLISPEEVENVYILKDATATALYGTKGINGVIVVNTKRGKANSRSITLTYDHAIQRIAHKPKFADGYTYGLAINEARANDGLSTPRYMPWEMEALKNGEYPYLYPNVDWVDQVFGNTGAINKYTAEFRGGTEKFRYYAMANLITENGFIKNPNSNDGYSTQDKFSRGNVRMNLDIDLTSTTKLAINVFGSLSESQRPGYQADLWDMVYTVPSAAFPIKSENGTWGGSSTWGGTLNPVAQSTAAGYYKNHIRTLNADLTIKQDLGMILPGLGAQVRIAYDNTADIYENHSKTYVYSNVNPTWPEGQDVPTFTEVTEGVDSQLGSDSKVSDFHRFMHLDAGFNYQRKFGDLNLFSQLKWEYEYTDPYGLNNTVYRQNINWWTHLNYANRYMFDLTLVETGSSRLAPGSKWAFSPTVGISWVASNEAFWTNPDLYLKVRASAGRINTDYIPFDTWAYYVQSYVESGVTYPFTNDWSSSFGQTALGQMATTNPGREHAYKYNVGIDFGYVEGLNVSLDLYKERRAGIWVSSAGKYCALIGMTAPYENAGIVDSKGIELSADYSKTFGDWTISVGGNFNYNTNKIVDMLEEPQLYPNLVQTGHQVGQIYGLVADGFFKDAADIASSPTQTFTTVRPGDIKYVDINGDNVIDANDVTAIGHTSTCPNIYYNFRIGAEWKGLGIYADFQGTGKYTAILNTKAMYWPLINNTNISEYAYENSWRPGNENALFPALSSSSNSNNYRTSTLWLRDRSFLKLRNLEVYYNLPKTFLNKLKVVNGAKVYFRGTDLFATSNVPQNDPECYGINPVTKTFAFGLSVTF